MLADSNLQRKRILPGERVLAYKLKLDVLNHQGGNSGHELRHTYATICYEELDLDIKDISRTLGHSELRTTQNIYIHQSMNTSKKLSDKFSSAFVI